MSAPAGSKRSHGKEDKPPLPPSASPSPSPSPSPSRVVSLLKNENGKVNAKSGRYANNKEERYADTKTHDPADRKARMAAKLAAKKQQQQTHPTSPRVTTFTAPDGGPVVSIVTGPRGSLKGKEKEIEAAAGGGRVIYTGNSGDGLTSEQRVDEMAESIRRASITSAAAAEDEGIATLKAVYDATDPTFVEERANHVMGVIRKLKASRKPPFGGDNDPFARAAKAAAASSKVVDGLTVEKRAAFFLKLMEKAETRQDMMAMDVADLARFVWHILQSHDAQEVLAQDAKELTAKTDGGGDRLSAEEDAILQLVKNGGPELFVADANGFSAADRTVIQMAKTGHLTLDQRADALVELLVQHKGLKAAKSRKEQTLVLEKLLLENVDPGDRDLLMHPKVLRVLVTFPGPESGIDSSIRANGVTSEYEWLRGFCVTMDQCVFTFKECLLSATVALGMPRSSTTKLSTSKYRREVLDQCIQYVRETYGDNRIEMDANDASKCVNILKSMSAFDIMSMNEETAWLFCEVLLMAHNLCPVPSRIAPLAMRWVHAMEKTDTIGCQKASELVSNFFAKRGFPATASRIIDRTIIVGLDKALLKPLDIAILKGMQVWHLKNCGEVEHDGDGLKVCLEAIALLGTVQEEEQASAWALRSDLHMHAAELAKRLDRVDEERFHLDRALDVLVQATSSTTATERYTRGLSFRAAHWTGKRASLWGHLMCFEEALALLKVLPPETRSLVKINGFTVDEFEAVLRECLKAPDRNTLAIGGDWRLCKACDRVAKGMLWCPCTRVWYCNAECQQKHWPEHELHCTRCWGCDKPGIRFAKCSRCMRVRFCSSDCMAANWKRHRPFCEAKPHETAHEEEEMIVQTPSLNQVQQMKILHLATPPTTSEGWFNVLESLMGRPDGE